MTEYTYYARGDSSTANNASLNAQGTSTTPTTALTFTNLGDPNNDMLLDFNSGLPDPDTFVIMNGITYSFTVQMTGFLPTSSKLANVNGVDLRGDAVTIISINGKRYFFMPDQQLTLATMNAFPNGAHTLTGTRTSGAPALICFGEGTLIATPDGPRAVETLAPGDLVLASDGRAVPVLWRGVRRVGGFEALQHPSSRAVVIPAASLGAGLPARELRVSPSHRLAFGGWQAEILFGVDKVLIPAEHLVGVAGIRREAARDGQAFHHILCEGHEMVIAEGLEAETFQPGERAFHDRSDEDLARLLAALPEGGFDRPDRYRSLKSAESRMFLALLGLDVEKSDLDRAA